MHAMDAPAALSEDAEELLLRHPFPGNVRELLNLLKRALILKGDDDEYITAAHLSRLLVTSPFVSAHMEQREGPQVGEHVTLEELEKAHIKRLLEELHNVSEVARIVGIDRRTLQRKMIAWGLRDESGG